MIVRQLLHRVTLAVGIDDPSVSLLNPDYQTRQLLELINEAGQSLCRRAEWSQLMRRWQIAGGATHTQLPADFQKLSEKGDLRLNATHFIPLRPVTNTALWAMIGDRPSKQYYYRLTQGGIDFAPALPSGGAVTTYVSTQWLRGSDAAVDGEETIVIPAALLERDTVWRWRRQKGLPYEDVQAELESDLIAAVKADRGEI